MTDASRSRGSHWTRRGPSRLSLIPIFRPPRLKKPGGSTDSHHAAAVDEVAIDRVIVLLSDACYSSHDLKCILRMDDETLIL